MRQLSVDSSLLSLAIWLSMWSSSAVAQKDRAESTSQNATSRIGTFTTREDRQILGEHVALTRLRRRPSGVLSAEGETGSEKHQAIERTDANSVTAHQQLVAKAKQGKIDVYFAGDSITRRWGATDYPNLLANWRKNFHGWNAANFAWGGDTTHNILWRLQNGELDRLSPKVVVLQAGTNNVGHRPGNDATVEDVSRGIKTIIELFRKNVPNATIVLTAIFPRNDNMAVMPTINRINDKIALLADGKQIRFLNINDQLADRDGKLLPGMSRDKLHPSEKAYQIWADALKPILEEVLGPPAEEDQAPPPTGDPSASK